MFNGRKSTILRERIAQGVLDVITPMIMPMSPAQKMQNTLSYDVVNDEETFFVMKSFGRKFGVPLHSLSIVPIIDEKNLTIGKWAMTVNKKTVIEGNGYSEVLDKMTEYMLSKDMKATFELATKMEACYK